ncbi:RNA methyltransferase [Candidatus Bathyarchaeota archaeon]|nr:MAG: RNA methyltransferase [Candidatus Bathyarchaeota archaeon]
MLEGFNLLVSSARGNEREANEELGYLIRELGDPSPRTDYTAVSGLTVAKTNLDPVRVISRLRPLLREKPWEFRYVLKVKPVGRVVNCTVEEISEAASAQSARIKEDETFRISVEKRRSKISSKEVIDAVAAKLPRKVDLRNPAKIVLVEIIGHVAGISIVDPKGILGIEREKRSF